MPRFMTIKNARTLDSAHYEAWGLRVVGEYVGEQSSEVTVEVPRGVDLRVLEQFGRACRCERVTMFGVEHSTPNSAVAMGCRVAVVGDHLCGSTYDNTKDITVLVTDASYVTALGKYCKTWKSVSPAMSTKARTRESTNVVLMLQVVLPPGTVLTDGDKQRVLKLYLRKAGGKSMRCSGAGTTKKKGSKNAYTSVYTFYIKCQREKAKRYLQLECPMMDALPFETEKGGVVYLNTIQLCNKPAVYNNNSQYAVQLTRKDRAGSESSFSETSSYDCDTASEPSSEAPSMLSTASTRSYYRHNPYCTEAGRVDVSA